MLQLHSLISLLLSSLECQTTTKCSTPKCVGECSFMITNSLFSYIISKKIAIFFRPIVQLKIRYLCIIYVLIMYLIYIIVYYTIFENTNKMSKYFSYENLDDICKAKVVYWLFCHNIIWILWKFNDVSRLRVRHIPVGSTSRLSRLDYLPRYRDEER